LSPTASQLEGEADDALGPLAREDRSLDGDLVGGAGVEVPADLGVFPLGVLAHDDEVDVAGLLSGKRRTHPGVENGGPNAGELVEAAADRKEQPVERHVVLDRRMAHGSEEDGVEPPQQVEAVLRHHATVREVMLRAPAKLLALELEPEFRRGSVE